MTAATTAGDAVAVEPTAAQRLVPLRQLPTVIAFGLAMVFITATPDDLVTDWQAVYLAVALEVVATLAALILGRRPVTDAWTRGDPASTTIPVLSLVAIGILRVGTGGSASIFTAMLALPVVWIASEPGRRHIVLAAGGTAVALLLPYLEWVGGTYDPLLFRRALFVPCVYALAAVTVNELARRQRIQTIRLQERERELRAADQLTRSVLDAATEQAIIGTDRTGLVDVWNPGATALLGRHAEESQGVVHVVDLVAREELESRREPGDDGTPFEVLVRGVEPGRARVREATAVRADGSTVPCEVSTTVRLDASGAVAGYLFVASDLTRAKEAARMQDEFVGMVSHELRTPVSAILGHLELLRFDPLTPEQEEYVVVVERNARRLLRLVNDLLFTAQVAAGGIPVTMDAVDLRSVVAAALESARPAAHRAGVALVADVPDDVPALQGDAGRLGQAVDNLVSNAVKFTPRGGTVTVTVSPGADDDVVVSVADTGVGIPADEVDRLFGRFFRSSNAVRDAVPGAGLGLNITRAIVAAHGGSVSVSSIEGTGTTFEIHLPRGAASGSPSGG